MHSNPAGRQICEGVTTSWGPIFGWVWNQVCVLDTHLGLESSHALALPLVQPELLKDSSHIKSSKSPKPRISIEKKKNQMKI